MKKFLALALLLAANQAQAARPHPAKQPKQPKIEACALLTSAEIEAVQGEPIAATTPSLERGMSECVFTTATPAKSVSLAVAMPAKSGLTPRQIWTKQFHPAKKQERAESDKAGKREEENEGSAPQAVSGLGDQAYWMANPVAGALYVLRGDKFIRLSLGGIPKQSDRLAKSKLLARNILARLR